MKEVSQRPSKVITIKESENIKTAAEKMLTEKIGCLIVNDENGKFVGLLTERDIANRVAVSAETVEKTTVGQIMTARVVSCPPGTPASKAREIMTNNKIRHLPIIENDQILGILSVRDLMQQQLLEDRAAAKEVAMLSKCLKSIDLKEAADIVTKEVPKLFQAGRCVLCLFKNSSDTEKAELLSYNNCSCPESSLKCQAPSAFVLLVSPAAGQQLAGKTTVGEHDEEQFTYEHFSEQMRSASRNIKMALVGKDAVVVGLSNSAFQDIIYRAKVHPKRKSSDLSDSEMKSLYEAIQTVVRERLKLGGKTQFADLYGKQGGYSPAMGPNMKDESCPNCGTMVEKIAHGGGHVYLCPECQK